VGYKVSDDIILYCCCYCIVLVTIATLVVISPVAAIATLVASDWLPGWPDRLLAVSLAAICRRFCIIAGLIVSCYFSLVAAIIAATPDYYCRQVFRPVIIAVDCCQAVSLPPVLLAAGWLLSFAAANCIVGWLLLPHCCRLLLLPLLSCRSRHIAIAASLIACQALLPGYLLPSIIAAY
jgi:hypothetical protein